MEHRRSVLDSAVEIRLRRLRQARRLVALVMASAIGDELFHLEYAGTPYRQGAIRFPVLMLTVTFGLYPVIVLIHRPLRRWRRHRKGLCLKCGYDLTGNVSGRCPECGTPRKGVRQ